MTDPMCSEWWAADQAKDLKILFLDQAIGLANGHVEGGDSRASVIIREMQISTNMSRYYFIPCGMAIIRRERRREGRKEEGGEKGKKRGRREW